MRLLTKEEADEKGGGGSGVHSRTHQTESSNILRFVNHINSCSSSQKIPAVCDDDSDLQVSHSLFLFLSVWS